MGALACCAERRDKSESLTIESKTKSRSQGVNFHQSPHIVTSDGQVVNTTVIIQSNSSRQNLELFGEALCDLEDGDPDPINDYLRNKYEYNLDMNKKGLLDLYEKTMNEGKWDNKLSEDKLSIAVKQKGTLLSKEQPCILADMYFDPAPGVTTQNLIKYLHNPEFRQKWDKDVEYGKNLEVAGNGNILIFHQRMKSAISYIQRRDFLEKKIKLTVPITFEEQDSTKVKRVKHFVFFTSVPDEINPPEKTVTRAQMLLGIHVFERLEDGRIKFSALMQNDFNLGSGAISKVATVATINQLPKNLSKWFHQFETYLKQVGNEEIQSKNESSPDEATETAPQN